MTTSHTHHDVPVPAVGTGTYTTGGVIGVAAADAIASPVVLLALIGTI